MQGIVTAWKRRQLKSEVEHNLRAGVGLHKNEWLVPCEDLSSDALHTISHQIVDWCAQVIASSRRPYGIDQLAAAIACACAESREGGIVASATFDGFSPADFYADGGTRDAITRFVQSLEPRTISRDGGDLRFAVALFSWGDLANRIFERRS